MHHSGQQHAELPELPVLCSFSLATFYRKTQTALRSMFAWAELKNKGGWLVSPIRLPASHFQWVPLLSVFLCLLLPLPCVHHPEMPGNSSFRGWTRPVQLFLSGSSFKNYFCKLSGCPNFRSRNSAANKNQRYKLL